MEQGGRSHIYMWRDDDAYMPRENALLYKLFNLCGQGKQGDPATAAMLMTAGARRKLNIHMGTWAMGLVWTASFTQNMYNDASIFELKSTRA